MYTTAFEQLSMATPLERVETPVSRVFGLERIGRREMGGKFATCFLTFLERGVGI